MEVGETKEEGLDVQIIEAAVARGLSPHRARKILNSTGQSFLDGLAEASYEFTDAFLPLIHDIIADTFQRWLQKPVDSTQSLTASIDAFARFLPFHSTLLSGVRCFLERNQSALVSLFDLDDGHIHHRLLVGYFRLLSHDVSAFRDFVPTSTLVTLFDHSRQHIRYLAIQCLAIRAGIADHAVQLLITQHVQAGAINGQWEDYPQIDYRLFKLYEERRWRELHARITDNALRSEFRSLLERFDHQNDLAPFTVSIAGLIIPSQKSAGSSTSSFVLFDTSLGNLRKAVTALSQTKPCLLYGPVGSGKTSIVRELASKTGQLANIVTLHLNEQTDAKSLLGIYATSVSGPGFSWQPGVITKAVKEGKWIVIEDIDRAPAEVMGILRPLIENNELYLPARKERIRPHDNFRLFATVRTAGANVKPVGRNTLISNPRLWYAVSLAPYSFDELRVMLEIMFSSITSFLPAILQTHRRLIQLYAENPLLRGLSSRTLSIRHLIKWCRRIAKSLPAIGVGATAQIPETFMLETLKNAIDCYAAHIAEPVILHTIAMNIAESLNVAPSAAEFVLKKHNPIVQYHKSSLQVGRISLTKVAFSKSNRDQSASFAFTRCVRQTMESVAAAVAANEPLLLVGETGVGKTTTLQHIARSIHQNLTVINLSNQSEASDLLGGLKPVSIRTLTMPMYDEFNDLFDKTFAGGKNDRFRDSIAKAFTKQRWPILFRHWDEAVQLALKNLPQETEDSRVKSTSFQEQNEADPLQLDKARASKRRKVDPTKYKMLRDRWTTFSQSIKQAKAHVQRGEHSQVFAFVESRLVQAVRSGDWLLLDEINLASSETLDNIVSLLNSGGDEDTPYLLLTEAGSVERIKAHPNFRVFAAMNPATDAGKKDLPPAIRSHFTEIFVQSPDSEVDDLVSIIQVYLGAILEHDKRAAHDLAKGYLALKQLSDGHKLTDGAGELPHFSLRSLTRTLSYARQHFGTLGLRRALREGLEMAFCTILDPQSHALAVAAIENNLAHTAQARRAMQAQKKSGSSTSAQEVSFEHYRLIRGPMSTDVQANYIITKSVRRNLANLARAASMQKFPILLQGPTSAGKTSMVEYLSKYTGNEFVRINNHEHTDLQEYLGSYRSGVDGKLEYCDGVLVEALRNGHWLVLDELNLAPSDVLEALNRLLDDNRELLIPETQEIIRPHPNFMLFATQNPAGLYGGRKRLSRAFRNRFIEIHLTDIPEDELEIILEERTHIPKSFCKNIVDVYKYLTLQRQSSRLFEARNSFATLRDLFRWASRPASTRDELAQHGYMLLAERVRDGNEKFVVKAAIEDVMKVKINEKSLYNTSDLLSTSESISGIVWTRAMRRLFVLVSEALNNNEPVLLVGETGCGKTQVCQMLAQVSNRQLHIYNAHSNTETGDLIGSQRPTRHKSALAASIMQDLEELGDDYGAMRTTKIIDIDDLIKQFGTMDTSTLDRTTVQKVKNSIAAYQSLFEWSDGALVRAMKEGCHFLLDEISLADDSVLERMNSVLEPARTILLAEKGADDNFVTAKPGFQFLATMNPGGDYGKRELSAALRNRLTEIWVPPLSDEDDVLPILRARLAPANTQHQVDVSAMVKFAQWFREEIQRSANHNIPLRLLLGWSEYIRTSGLPVPRAIVHGAAMTFIDSIGTNPAGLMAATNMNDIDERRNLCLAKLETLFGVEANSIYWTLPVLTLNDSRVNIGDVSLMKVDNSAKHQDLVFEAPTTVRNALRIVRAIQTSRPLLLEGNPGVGKTAIVTSLAHLSGNPLTRINLSDQTDLMDLFGADAPTEGEQIGHFAWHDGPLLKAMQAGEWVLLDEMNLASQSVLEGLNACLDHRKKVYIAELDRTFQCHPNFTLFATQNPHSQGGGRKGLPASFVNRFTVVYADPFTTEDLLCICRSSYPGISAELIAKVIDVITKVQSLAMCDASFSYGGPWELNLRDVSRLMALCKQNLLANPAIFVRSVITDRFRSSSAVEKIDIICKQVFESDTAQSLYHDLTSKEMQYGTALCSRNTLRQYQNISNTLTIQQLPAAESFMIAWQMNWPVILAGPTGSGKTSLVRAMAGLRGDRLVEVSMNADTDTADLVGGYEQYDLQRTKERIKADLRQLLMDIYLKLLSSGSIKAAVPLIAVYETLTKQFPSSKSFSELISHVPSQVFSDEVSHFAELVSKLQALDEATAASSARFEWIDGILIDALQSGSWLVLDNANLCNASVLDRLNSLLEPNGSLILSEQQSADGRVRTIHPAPGFRIILTMDPKHGELSRAMRNRSLEIFMGTNPYTQNDCTLPAYPADSTLPRLRRLFDHNENDREDPSGQLEPYHEHLHPNEVDVVQVEGKQPLLPTGLDVHTEFRTFINLAEASPISWPVLPVMNEPVLMLHRLHEKPFVKCATKLHLIRNSYRKVKATNQPFLPDLKSKRSRTVHHLAAVTYTLQLLLDDMTSEEVHDFGVVVDAETQKNRDLHTQSDTTLVLQKLVSLYTDISELVRKHDQLFVHTYRQMISSLVSTVAPSVLPIWQVRLSQLVASGTSLNSGQSLQTMWPSWKSETVSSQERFDTKIAAERLMSRFDEVVRKTPGNIEHLAQLRAKLLEVCIAATKGREQQGALDTITSTIDDLAGDETSSTSAAGHFHDFFTTALNKLRLRGRTLKSEVQQSYPLLGNGAGVTDYEFVIASEPVQLLYRLSGSKIIQSTRQVDASPFELDLRKLTTKLSTTQDQSISRLDYAQDEVEKLLKLVSNSSKELLSNDLRHIVVVAFDLARPILAAHRHLLPSTSDSQSLDDVAQLAMIAGEAAQSSSAEVSGVAPVLEDIVLAYQRLSGSLDSINIDKCTRIGSGLFVLAMSCLKLFVPDQQTDPAMLPLLYQIRYEKRKTELTQRIATWQGFQQEFTGQDKSFVIRLLEEELSNLEEPPQFQAIWRPDDPKYAHEVHVEFQNLLRSVVHSEVVINVQSQQGKDLHKACDALINNIRGCYRRLERLHRAYFDLVQPVQALLGAMALGVLLMKGGGMVQAHNDRQFASASPEDQSRLSLLPALFSNMKVNIDGVTLPEIWTHLRHLRLQFTANSSSRQGLQALSSHQTRSKEQTSLLAQIVDVADIPYTIWKEKLSSDQQAAEIQARYYAYRGEEDGREPDEADVRALFPVYDDSLEGKANGVHNDDDSIHDTSGEDMDVRVAAVELSKYFRTLQGQQNVQQLLRDEISDQLHVRDEMHIGIRKSQTLAAEHFPALVLNLHKNAKQLNGASTSDVRNVYVDADIREVQELRTVITHVRNRFQYIAECWPEHAVPVEVLSYCDQSLQMKINDPIAKLLSRAEKLLDLISQWQAVASKEWSVSSLMDQLTALIIHWRRLELGSWSRLLDLEDTKQQEEADAWYFIAYETVVHNSIRQVSDDRQPLATDDLREYRNQLAKTLEEFLTNTSLGQFRSRLVLLKSFSDMLQAYAKRLLDGEITSTSHTSRNGASELRQQEGRELWKVKDTVQNIIHHYDRYVAHIDTLLHTGRSSLEKKVAEQIKLASWKDTNVSSLKESARRTHYKLFRVVKQYRTLLSQSINAFVADYDANLMQYTTLPLLEDVSIDLDAIQKAAEHCSIHVPTWSKRSERLRRPDIAIRTMQYAYTSGLHSFTPAMKLQQWLQDVKNSATGLRKRTPGTATEDNQSAVRDLKQQKRRLLADTMKELAQMGLRRNLGTSELQSQANSHLVLANVPHISSSIHPELTETSRSAFGEFLDTMRQARSEVIEHSTELTDGETRRGLGHLEGLLALLINQRVRLASFTQQLGQFTDVVRMLQVSGEHSQTQHTSAQLSKPLFSHLLTICANVVEIQASHIQGQSRIGDLPHILRTYAEALNDSSTSVREVQSGVSQDVTRFSQDEPQIEWLAQYLQPCLEQSVQINSVHKTPVHLETFDDSFQKTLNAMFVALQGTVECTKTIPTISEEHGWLARTTQAYERLCSSTKLDTIIDMLNPILLILGQSHVSNAQKQTILALTQLAQPIIAQFQAILQHISYSSTQLHLQMCHTAVYLGKTFTMLCKEGFCTPPESADNQEQSGKVEQGTGLGEGEAAQDISKDVGDDEDLTELAQEKGDQDQGEQEMDKSNDAVDMGAEDMEGEMGSGDEQVSGDEAESGDEGDAEIDEETGSVDDLDPNAVDEKMWDDMQKEAEQEDKELKSQKAQGQKSGEQTTRGEEQEYDADQDLEAKEADGDADEYSAETQKPEGENIDPHLDQEQALELPEDVQLNGEQEVDEDMSNDGMDELSDIDENMKPEDVQQADLPDEEQIDRDGDVSMSDDAEDDADDDRQGHADDDDAVEDQPDDTELDNQQHETRQEDTIAGLEDQESGETGAANTREMGAEEQDDENAPEGGNETEAATQQSAKPQVKQSSAEDQSGSNEGALEQSIGQQDDTQDKSAQALQKLADVLERYHQRREIYTSNEQRAEKIDQDIDMQEADFEHVDKAEDEQAQALGTAEQQHAQDLDRSKAIEDSRTKAADELPIPEDRINQGEAQEQETLGQKMTRIQREQQEHQDTQELSRYNSALPSRTEDQVARETDLNLDEMDIDKDNNNDHDAAQLDIDNAFQQLILPDTMSASEAQHLWSLTTNRTSSLSLALTEQLRLILAPTTATKLRGDFRTGKRLNIRRIIPYIASGYKRDKIWMRRSTPSKRNYQVMLAVDDSKSMKESGADVLALETLCLVSRSLSMLEVGELCVIAFGKDYRLEQAPGTTPKAVKVAHEFGVPFSPNSSGPETFAHFSFEQTGTNVKALLSESIRIFSDARMKSTAREASELWQLQLIISDGHIGSDSESVARLVRKAREEKIMCVFVIVDNSKESILDLKEVVFEKPAVGAKGGKDILTEPVITTKRYLEGFPFQYYVVVRDVMDLPGVLSRVLRGWFESVVEQG